jgi:tripartite-type tricarboxylate transporter receptor subunit TctC
MMTRRHFLTASVACFECASAGIAQAQYQTYPARPVTMIVPLGAGSVSDLVARVVADRMAKSLGQPIIIENVSGADGSIGTGRSARATPNGYTILYGFASAMVLNGAFYSLPYDVLKDFAPISPVTRYLWVLFARKTMPANDLHELIVWLKANRNKASSGVSTAGYRLLNLAFQKETGTRYTLVPYRGTPPMVQDLLAGNIDLWFGSADQLPLVRAGSIKACAVTGEMRLAAAPDIPTFDEMGLPAGGVDTPSWHGLFAPSGTPKEVISKLNAAVVDALADLAVQSRLADISYQIFPREQQTPAALAALQKSEIEKWWPIIKAAGIKPE